MLNNLFIDTTNNCLVLILEVDNKIVDSFIDLEQNRASDFINDELEKLLKKNKKSLSDINNFYIVKGPGSYTGVKVGIMIGRTCKLLNEKVNVYLLSSLALMSNSKDSVCLIDAKSKKYYVGVYKSGQALFPDQLIDFDLIDDFLDSCKNILDNPSIIKDYKIDHKKCFINMKDKFTECKNVRDIEPLYIKSFI